MNNFKLSGFARRGNARRGAIVFFINFLLLFQPLFFFSVDAQKRSAAPRKSSTKAETLTDNQQIAHVLERLSFGARPGDFERVKALGVAAYIEQQLNPDTIPDSALDERLAKLSTLALSTPALIEQYTPPKPAASPSPSPQPIVNPATGAAETKAPAPVAAKQLPARNPQQIITELQRAAFLRAVYSERQLNEMIVDFWENHFSIYANKDSDRFMMTSFDRDAIRPFALGRFRDLLGAVARSPAMLYYLDNWQSSVPRHYPATKDKPARNAGGINENYARELMELHTLGVDGGYTQHDVQEVARCFTGWTIRKPNDEGLFLFNPATHDNAEKIVLGQKIPAGGGISDAERVLDILARHTSTAHFIATKLARRFISDDPPAFVVNRAADVFLKTDGSIRETLRSIITSPEFFARAAYRAKTRSPFEYAVAATRTLEADTNGDRPMLDWIARMGESLFGRLTPDGYPDRADQWLSTGNLLQRFNFANALAANKIRGTSVNASRLLQGIDSGDASHIAERLAQLALAGDITPQTKAALASSAAAFQKPTQATALSQATTATATLAAPQSVNNLVSGNANHTAANKTATAAVALPVPPLISELLTLVIGSPEFQRR